MVFLDDDAISNAIVSGNYSRSPSIVIVRNQVSNDLNSKLSEELETLRQTESEKTKTSKQESK